MALNIGLNQYAKDDAYRISRYRENLQLNTRNWNFKIFPDWLKNQFPKVFGRVPTSIEVKQSDVETQGSYHLLWAFKMLHFTHLASWVILPAAVVIARALAWGYTKSLQSKLKSEFEKSPTPERQRALEATNAQLRDLNKSWWDLYYIPKETGWWIIKSTGKLVKYVSTGIREYLHPELPVTYSGADGNSQVCPRAFSGQSFLPSNPLLAK